MLYTQEVVGSSPTLPMLPLSNARPLRVQRGTASPVVAGGARRGRGRLRLREGH